MVRITIVCLVFCSYGLLPARARAADTDAKALAAKARKVFSTSCHRCHRGPGSDSGYEFDVLNVKTLTAPKGEEVLVPGKPGDSKLWQIIEHHGFHVFYRESHQLYLALFIMCFASFGLGGGKYSLDEKQKKKDG